MISHLLFLCVPLDRGYALRVCQNVALHPCHDSHDKTAAPYNGSHQELQGVAPKISASGESHSKIGHVLDILTAEDQGHVGHEAEKGIILLCLID